MAITRLDAKTLKKMLAGGMANLRLDAKRIDNLNVFPIPDGDTGNNMTMTITGGVSALSGLDVSSVGDMMKKFARGALLAARGNSGVILSQFFKGFSVGCEGTQDLDIDAFTAAFKAGVDRAYEAVIQPVEGTVLTVMSEGYEYVSGSKDIEDFEGYFKELNERMEVSLENTPNLLAVLKESGVVDSGGAGFLAVFTGMEKILLGEEIEGADDLGGHSGAAAPHAVIDKEVFNADSKLEFGYCTEFILQLMNAKTDISAFDLNRDIVDYLNTIGDSIVAIMDEDLVKVHVHTFTPGNVLNYAQKYGEFVTLKIENMSIQHNENSIFRKKEEMQEELVLDEHIEKKEGHRPIGVVAVANGEGLRKLFLEMGVDICIDGGQTENPSTEDFLEAFENIDADDIIVLPGNSNIVMASSQAADIYKKARVHIVKAKTLAETFAAVSMMDLTDGDTERVIEEMQECIDNVRTGLVTTAIRDVRYDNIDVFEGHYIGMDRAHIISDDPDRIQAAIKLIEGLDDIHDREVLTVFYGEGVDADEVSRLETALKEHFAWLECEFISGGQKVYDYIFAAE